MLRLLYVLLIIIVRLTTSMTQQDIAMCTIAESVPELQNKGWLNCSITSPRNYSLYDYVYSDSEDNIIEIVTSDTLIGGTIPTEIGYLAYINKIDFKSISFNEATIPNEISNLTYLVYMEFQGNGISGTLPDIPDSLKYIFIQNTSISGTIPSSYYFAQYLLLEFNNLSSLGDIPTNFTITAIVASYNQLTGTIPSYITSNSIVDIILNNNELTGNIPLITSTLDYLDLSYNRLDGTFPNSRVPYGVQFLILSNNNISGTLPEIFGSNDLDVFDISNNKLSGTLPSNIFSSLVVRTLNIGGNNFYGCPPIEPNYLSCIYGGYFYTGCGKSNCNVTYDDDCKEGSGYYSSICAPCSCDSGYICNDGVNGDGSCTIPNPCLNNTCEGICVPNGLLYTCECSLPAVLNITDQMSCICPYGYYKYSKGICYECDTIDNCFSIVTCSNSSNSYCEVCNNGYYSVGSTCEACPQIENCFSMVTCDNTGISKCYSCEAGYISSNNMTKCTIQDECLFGEWSEWSKCPTCEGNSLSTRIRDLSPLNTALVQICFNNLTESVYCGFPCVDDTITSADGGISYIYSSFTKFNWLNSLFPNDNLTFNISDLSIVFHNTNNNIISTIYNTSIEILPSISKSRFHIQTNNNVSTLTIDNTNSNTIIYAIVIPVTILLLLILLLFGVYYRYSNNDKWRKYIPDELITYFTNKRGSTKYESVYMKLIPKDDKDFSKIWSTLDTENISVSEVYFLYNPILSANFFNYRQLLSQKMKQSPQLFSKRDWMLKNEGYNLRTYVVERYNELVNMFEWNKDNNCSIIPCVHGTDFEIGKSIASNGYSSLSSLDAGFYGKGIYFTSYCSYATPYFNNKTTPSVLVSFGVFGNTYPVIESPKHKENFVGLPITSGYQSHFILTKLDGSPITDPHTNNEYNELVISQEAQVVSVFLVKINVINNIKNMKRNNIECSSSNPIYQ